MTKQPKKYLTPELIQEVLRQANDPVWGMGIYSKFAKNWYDVIGVTQMGLIHFSGNEDTGWQHITDRHGFFSNTGYFGEGALGNPNKFSRQSTPGDDYRNVAEDVFLLQKQDTKPHEESHLFEKYRGWSSRYAGSGGKEVEFQLIVYKGTKIVHSLYPSKNIDGKLPKRILHTLVRDKVNIGAATFLGSDYFLIKVPYINEAGITRYIAIFKVDIASLMTKVYIQVNGFGGVPIQTTYPHHFHFKMNIDLPKPPFQEMSLEYIRFMNTLSITDLSKLEKVIDTIEKDIQEYVATLNTDSSNAVTAEND